jgi:hypothetical protein
VLDVFLLQERGKPGEEVLEVVGLLRVLNEKGALEGSPTKLVSDCELEHLS